MIAATHRDYRKTAETGGNVHLAAHPDLRMVWYGEPQRPWPARTVLRSRRLAERSTSLSTTAARRSRSLPAKRRGGFTIGQDLAYQPYQALSVLFEALMGQRPDRDTYVTACPLLNSESI
ncbi:MAG: hypothetical protein ACLSHO_13930 [Dysosmobacter sp.]